MWKHMVIKSESRDYILQPITSSKLFLLNVRYLNQALII